MKSRTHRGPTGFTLIEIMIVVTIIALLSSIAVPSFIRARKRAQATRILDDLRLIDAAIDLYGIENSKGGGDPANWLDIQPYLKKDMVLYNSGGYDLLGNRINDTLTFSVDVEPRLSVASFSALSDIAPPEFWSPYAP